MKDLKDAIGSARDDVARIRQSVKSGDQKPSDLSTAQERLRQLEFFSKGWLNAKLDALLEDLKAVGMDVRQLRKGIRAAAL